MDRVRVTSDLSASPAKIERIRVTDTASSGAVAAHAPSRHRRTPPPPSTASSVKLPRHGKPLGRPRKPVPRLVTKEKGRAKGGGITLLDAVADQRLFLPWFKQSPESWTAWFAVIAAIFGLPMTPDQLAIYQRITGRQEAPTTKASEVWLVCGRRAGKSFILALCAVYLACFYSFAEYLAPGERATIMIIASDRRQSRVILRYISALLKNIPLLAKMIEREVAEGFDLNNSISIEIATASFRSVRGYTNAAVLMDELAYFQNDEGSASPDHEILKAIRPSMASIPTSLLLCASSPYAKRGALYDAHHQHFGKEHDPVLVVQADTRTLNPTIPQDFIDAEYAKDPASASAEFGAQFRSDLEDFISMDVLMQCVSDDVHERPRESGQRYRAFADPAGGSGKDSFTLCIGHKDKVSELAIIDCLREARPPFSPEVIVEQYAKLLKSYGVSKVIGDKFAGMWVIEPFKRFGISYEPSAAPKSDLYRDALPLVNSRKADLLDHPKMLNQFAALQRRVARSGKDSIDHPPGAHDDLANVAAGLLTNLGTKTYKYISDLSWVGDDPKGDDANADWRAARLQSFMNFGSMRRW